MMQMKGTSLNHSKFRGLFGFLFLCIFVELITRTKLIDPIILAPPTKIALTLVKMLIDINFLKNLISTILRVSFSIIIGGLLGITLGLIFGSNHHLYSYFENPLHALRSVPSSAFYPIIAIIFGIGNASVIAMAGFPTMLIVLVATESGVRGAHKGRANLAKILDLSKRKYFISILLPEATPHIVTGLKTGASYALVIIIALELFVGGYSGLGQNLNRFQTTYDIAAVYATLIVAGSIGFLINAGLGLIEKRSTHWVGR